MAKRKTGRTSSGKAVWLLAAFLLLLTVSVGGTLAFLANGTGSADNHFTLQSVPIQVIEDYDGEVKNDVAVKSLSEEKSAYIRARVVANWVEVDDGGELTGNVYGGAPVEGVDYSMEWKTDTGWAEYPVGSGYYYYTEQVEAGQETGVLFTGCAPILVGDTGKTANQPDGYRLSVEIIAQSIQADGVASDGVTKPVVDAWDIDPETLQ